MVIQLAQIAAAHPPMDASSGALKSDAWERVVDIALQGPIGCFEATVAIAWEHRSGGWETAGRAESVWRFDHRIWRLDDWQIVSADERSLEVRIAPQLLGTSIDADVVYPMTKARTFRWPRPISTLPTRLFGQVQAVSIDELDDGSRRVREVFDWDGWKEVEGEIAVLVSEKTVPLSITIDAIDRWPDGCKIETEGELALSARGLPTSERWHLMGRCPLKDWDGLWTLQFGTWKPCAFSGPSDESLL